MTERFVLNKQTLMPLGLVLSMALAIAGGGIWLNGRLTNIDFRLANIESQLSRSTAYRWTSVDMRSWAQLLQAKNPNLTIPTPTPGDR